MLFLKILRVDFRKQVLNEKEQAQTLSRLFTTWMICEHFKISDTDGIVLDISDLLKIVQKGRQRDLRHEAVRDHHDDDEAARWRAVGDVVLQAAREI